MVRSPRKRASRSMGNRSIWRLNRVHGDVDALELGVVLDGGAAVLAADAGLLHAAEGHGDGRHVVGVDPAGAGFQLRHHAMAARRSEEHTSELQSLMRISY